MGIMRFVYIIGFAALFGGILFYSISQVKRMGNFLKIYNDPDAPAESDYDSPVKRKREVREIPKHSRKVMMSSLLIYLVILLLFILITTIHAYIIIAMFIPWLFMLYFTFHYIKLWKYHGYSVFLLIIMMLAVIAGSFMLSQMQFFKAAMDVVKPFFMSLISG